MSRNSRFIAFWSLALQWLASTPTSAILVHQEASTHWIPCIHAPRNCYPNLEYCIHDTHCAPEPWLALTLLFVTSLVTLTITLFWYYIANPKKHSIRWRVTCYAAGILSVLLFIGLILSLIFQTHQEIEQ